MTQNQVAYHNALELERHNKMTEQETNRHQLVQEALTKWQNALNNYQIAVNNAHYVRMDAETARANKVREAQNQWQMLEVARSNIANEDIRARANAINSAAVAETSRHQKAMERIQSSLNESVIDRNYAEVSYTGANTDYIQARTNTEKMQPSVINAENALRHSQETLNYAKVETEPTVRFSNAMSGFRQGSDAITGVFRTILPVVTGGASTAAQPDFWTQLSTLVRNK